MGHWVLKICTYLHLVPILLTFCFHVMYSVLYTPSFFAGNQGNHQNFVPSLVHHKLWLIWLGMKQQQQKKIWKEKSKWPTQKTEIFNIANSQYFFTKISGIGPWVSRINWCEAQQCGSTYMVIRLSDVSSRPYKLSHIADLRINLFYSLKDQSQACRKVWQSGGTS